HPAMTRDQVAGILHAMPPLDRGFEQIPDLRCDRQKQCREDDCNQAHIIPRENRDENRGKHAANRAANGAAPGLAWRNRRRKLRPANGSAGKIGDRIRAPDDREQEDDSPESVRIRATEERKRGTGYGRIEDSVARPEPASTNRAGYGGDDGSNCDAAQYVGWRKSYQQQGQRARQYKPRQKQVDLVLTAAHE